VRDLDDEHGHTLGLDAEDEAIVPDAHAAKSGECTRERFAERARIAREHVAFELGNDPRCNAVVEPGDRLPRDRQIFNLPCPALPSIVRW